MKIKNFFMNASPFFGWLGIALVLASSAQFFYNTHPKLIYCLMLPGAGVIGAGFGMIITGESKLPKTKGFLIGYYILFAIGAVATFFIYPR